MSEDKAEMQVLLDTSKDAMVKRHKELTSEVNDVINSYSASAHEELWHKGVLDNVQYSLDKIKGDHPEHYKKAQDALDSMNDAANAASDKANKFFQKLF